MTAITTQYQNSRCDNIKATILNTATESDAIDLSGTTLGGFIIPATFQGTTLTFQVSIDGIAFHGLNDPLGNVVTISGIVAGKAVNWQMGDLTTWRYLKFITGSAQTSNISIQCSCKPF
tara:strand:- start:82 stop:438 length:357 start_codon:yes stop_codon:yes gene_type:complete